MYWIDVYFRVDTLKDFSCRILGIPKIDEKRIEFFTLDETIGYIPMDVVAMCKYRALSKAEMEAIE